MYQVYADMAFYDSTFTDTQGAVAIDNTDGTLDKLLFKASRLVDRLTYRRSTNFDNLDADVQLAIKYAVCSQAEYEFINGDPYLKSKSEASDSVSIGSFSISKGGGNQQGDPRIGDKVSQMAYQHLLNSGLLYSGVKRKRPYTYQETFEGAVGNDD